MQKVDQFALDSKRRRRGVEISRILAIVPACVGDTVMAQSLFMALKDLDHGHAIDAVSLPLICPLLSRMPEVDNVIELDCRHGELGLLKRLRLGRTLRGKYDRAIVLPQSFKSALLPYFARVPRRTAHRGEMRYGVINDMRGNRESFGSKTKTIEYYVNLGADLARSQRFPQIRFPELRVREDRRNEAAARLGVDRSVPWVALIPGAGYGPSKRWPARYFGQLAEMLARDGLGAYVFGSSKERTIGEEVVASSGGGVRNLCGQTTLEEVIDLLSLARIVVANDSGLMHVAASVKRPIVAIYGSTSPGRAPPLFKMAKIQYLNLDCSPCRKRHCRYGHYRCLRDISVDRVYGSVSELLTESSSEEA